MLAERAALADSGNYMVAMREIQAYSDAIVREFRPQRIILFGSRARGEPGADSDVDLLVVMAHRGHPTKKAIEIRTRVDCRFALDLLVRSPAEMRRRLHLEDWFIREIIDQGKVLYEADNGGMGRKGRRRLSKRRTRDARPKSAKL